MLFPRALGYVDKAVTDLFDRLDKGVTPVPAILAKTFRSLSACRSTATPRRDNITVEKWMEILQNLKDKDIEWKAPWLVPGEILYRCRDFDWVPLLGVWGAVGYTPLLKKIREMTSAWKQIHRIKRLVVEPMVTSEYKEW
ncbi:hypothetical protein Goari_027245 [Gossypium aridum]|uniref:DUF7745 domain-containing protein n=1 Tax=Gossypium aridum TaxID=34290 RepID=A0A7J8YNH4_GOSAI|nr:hypothetical protein [Gossypium aridum]